MTTFKRFMQRGRAIVLLLAFGVGIVVPSLTFQGTAEAAGILTSRKVALDSNSKGNVTTDANGTTVAADTYYNGAQTKHVFTFTTATAGAVKGLVIMYCNEPLPQTTCTAPTGLNAANITSISSSAFASNTWTLDNTTAGTAGYFATGSCTGGGAVKRDNCVLFTQSGASSTSASTAVTVNVGIGGTTNYMTNPTATGNYYVRIATFSDTAYTSPGNLLDQGTVAFSITDPITINSAVQEMLNFSVGTANSAAGSTCTALGGGGAVGLGTAGGGVYVLSTSTVSNANSWFRLSTNAANGTDVDYSGDTLRSGSNTFTTSATAGTPAAGTEFFGLTIDTGGTGYSLTNLTRQTNYNSNTTFAFNAASSSPTLIAQASAGTPVACDTGVITYAATAGATTKPGIYKTNINYYAVPKF